MGDESQQGCNFLKDPLCLSDLISGGANFEINTDFDDGVTDDIFAELGGSDNEDELPNIDHSQLVSPWTEPFNDLKKHMIQINEHIWKKVTVKGKPTEGPVPFNARVFIRYNAYWEGEGAPFDSSYLRGSAYSFYTGRKEVIEGLEAAVRTMHTGESAQFIISYHLLFHEMGCPPRVKKCADGLFIIELVKFNEVGDINAEQQIPEEDRNKYAIVCDKVKDIHLKGLDFYNENQFKNACRAFEKAVNLLNFCQMSNDEEQQSQNAFLIKLYTNLAVSYLKIDLPGKTCIMCREIRRLTNNNPSCKALFQEGRALMMLGEFHQARSILQRALNMEPQNNDISKELKKLEERYSRYRENAKILWTKAIGMRKEPKEEPVQIEANLNKFEQELDGIVKSFKENVNLKCLTLPQGLTEEELKAVNTIANRMDIKVALDPLESTYTLKK